MRKIYVSLFVATVSVVGSAFALEPLKENRATYPSIAADRYLANFDQNGDGKFSKEEHEKQWRRDKTLDQNGDGALDREELEEREFVYVESTGKQLRNVRFKRTETEDVYLDFYFPEEDQSRQKPVVLYTHGGGWTLGSRHDAGKKLFGVVHSALLKQGFCVVSVDYRLINKATTTVTRDCVIDSKDALRFISAYRKELGIDPNRIYTFGDSAGGHLAQMILLSPPDSLKGDPELAKYSYKTVAGVSWYGPCDFEDVQLFNHDNRKKFRGRFGARIAGPNPTPEDKLKLYREMSPINYLTQTSPPLLMLQGDQDTTIPVKHAYHMQKKAEALGAPVEIVIVKNAGHGWRKVGAPINPSTDEIVERTIHFFVEHEDETDVVEEVNQFPGKKTDFRGFERYEVPTTKGIISVVCPKQAAPGKPWLWRSMFWGNAGAVKPFLAGDLQLLEQGYHVVIVPGNVSGHPKGNESIDAAYHLLTQTYGFSKTLSMASMSRETLALFRWATENPEKVESIYVDNGVCNVHSWPGGKLVPGSHSNGVGSAKSWNLLKKTYGFSSDEEALAAKVSPIDLLEPLARAGVPILMRCGTKDTTVPYEENGAILKERFEKLGGDIQIIFEEKDHHPHGLNDPTPVIKFIKKNTNTGK